MGVGATAKPPYKRSPQLITQAELTTSPPTHSVFRRRRIMRPKKERGLLASPFGIGCRKSARLCSLFAVRAANYIRFQRAIVIITICIPRYCVRRPNRASPERGSAPNLAGTPSRTLQTFFEEKSLTKNLFDFCFFLCFLFSFFLLFLALCLFLYY